MGWSAGHGEIQSPEPGYLRVAKLTGGPAFVSHSSVASLPRCSSNLDQAQATQPRHGDYWEKMLRVVGMNLQADWNNEQQSECDASKELQD